MTIPQWQNMSDAERSKAYSPSSALPDGELDQQIRRYADNSMAAYAALPDTRTVSYADRPANTIDIVTPADEKRAPLLVFIHGGYWQQLSKKESFFPATDTLSRGIAYAAIAGLPPEQALVMSLVLQGEFSPQAIARQLNLPVGTVMSRLARARAKLRVYIGIEASTPVAELL